MAVVTAISSDPARSSGNLRAMRSRLTKEVVWKFCKLHSKSILRNFLIDIERNRGLGFSCSARRCYLRWENFSSSIFPINKDRADTRQFAPLPKGAAATTLVEI